MVGSQFNDSLIKGNLSPFIITDNTRYNLAYVFSVYAG